MTAVIITVLFFVIIANGLHYMGGGGDSIAHLLIRTLLIV